MWFVKDYQKIISELKTNIQTGLSSKEAAKRLEELGPNQFNKEKKSSLFLLFIEQIKNPLVYILIAATIISLIIGEYSDAIIIVLVILLNTIIGVVQESKAEKALEELKKMTTPTANVRRDGTIKEIASEQLVPGDIIIIDAGRIIPADLRLIETANLKIEESSLTGESIPVEKDANWRADKDVPISEQQNMAFMSTISTYGRGVGVVVTTGMQTEIGKIASMLGNKKREQTPLQVKLAELGKILGIGAVIISFIIFLIGFLQGRDVIEMFMIAISLAVAAIPEGLPAIVTIVLALGVKRMVKRRAVVRKLPSVETLGAVNVICSDKTGTLTQNNMTVTHVYINGKYLPLTEVTIHHRYDQLFFEVISLCNDAVVSDTEQTGDPTEIALITAAKQLGFHKQNLDNEYKRSFELPFDSDRKMMSTVHNDVNNYLVMVKGALESILPRTAYFIKDGKKIPITASEMNHIKKQANKMSEKALRVLAVAYKEVPSSTNLKNTDLETDLILLGLTGMIDPPRLEVKASIAQCMEAGIRTVMITGDHQKTAFAIAKELGIAENESETMSGVEIDSKSNEEMKSVVKKVNVFARVSPEHKVKIVQALRANGEIVSMTGDGVNDAPSLEEADVGVAMGNSGTDVAKGAADIVLTDDNFETIAAAVEEGRNIYQNIKKSILFLLSCNFGEIVTLFIAILLGWPAPLTAVHILWVNLITDSLPAISLGLENKDPDIMKEKPRSVTESIFSHGGAQFTILNGLLIGSLTLAAFIFGVVNYSNGEVTIATGFSGLSDEVLMHAQTMAFITLSISQLFHSLNLRNNHQFIYQIGLFTNKYLIASILLGVSIQVGLVHIPFLNKPFGISPLAMTDWFVVLGLSILPIIFNELFKLKKKLSRKI